VVQSGHYVLLSISDNGTGMSPDVQGRIFEPFYTTKPKECGTGLGLATVYGIVKQSGGYIWVYSELGKGTTFKIYLPHTEQRLQSKEPVPASRVEIPASLGGTVLLVEDDPDVRRVTRTFLENTGLIILEASNSEDALDLASREGEAPRLLVTDLMLPGRDGVSLAKEMLSRNPRLKIILMSAYTEHGLPDLTSLKDAKFICKPFSRHELVGQVVSLLEKSASALATSPPHVKE
jgi:CheY-like chemotaxis protein